LLLLYFKALRMVQPPAYQPSFYILPILPILRGTGMLLFGWRQWLLTHIQETDVGSL
jgi:hypothetical protein